MRRGFMPNGDDSAVQIMIRPAVAGQSMAQRAKNKGKIALNVVKKDAHGEQIIAAGKKYSTAILIAISLIYKLSATGTRLDLTDCFSYSQETKPERHRVYVYLDWKSPGAYEVFVVRWNYVEMEWQKRAYSMHKRFMAAAFSWWKCAIELTNKEGALISPWMTTPDAEMMEHGKATIKTPEKILQTA